MRQGVAWLLLVFQREAVDVGRQHVQLVVTQVGLGGHVAVTTGTDGVLYLHGAGTVQPDIIGQVGSAQQVVALALGTVTGHAVGSEDLLAAFQITTFGLQTGQAADIGSSGAYTVFTDHGQPGSHGRLTALTQGGEELVGRTAQQRVVVARVREAVGTAGTRGVTYGAVGGEPALTDAARLFLTLHVGNRHVAVLGVDRLAAGVG